MLHYNYIVQKIQEQVLPYNLRDDDALRYHYMYILVHAWCISLLKLSDLALRVSLQNLHSLGFLHWRNLFSKLFISRLQIRQRFPKNRNILFKWEIYLCGSIAAGKNSSRKRCSSSGSKIAFVDRFFRTWYPMLSMERTICIAMKSQAINTRKNVSRVELKK